MSSLFLAFAILVIASTLVALVNWRLACFMLLLIGSLQDPVRKSIAGAPAILALSAAPVWFAIVASLLMQDQTIWKRFKQTYRNLAKAIAWLFVCLIPAALVSATYSPGSWKITILGILGVAMLPIGLLVGYQYPSPRYPIIKLLKVYCLLTAIMAVGGPLEYAGLAGTIPLLGTKMFNMEWIRYSSVAEDAKLIAGFYRSPDIYGYHTAMLTMLGFILALMSSGYKRLCWIALSGWGIIGVMLCGRRKMFMMVPLFILVLLWLNSRNKRNKRASLKLIIPVLAGCVVIGLLLYNYIGPNSAVEHHYFKTLKDIPARAIVAPFQSVRMTYLQNGFWGAGLGMASLGAHHVHVARPHVWQEDGMGRMLVEFGVPGFIAFAVFGIILFRIIYRIARAMDVLPQHRRLYAGLAAVIVANAASFVVSHQIFGDIFIGCIISLLIGYMLSGTRFLPPGTMLKKAKAPLPLPRRPIVHTRPDEPARDLHPNA